MAWSKIKLGTAQQISFVTITNRAAASHVQISFGTYNESAHAVCQDNELKNGNMYFPQRKH